MKYEINHQAYRPSSLKKCQLALRAVFDKIRDGESLPTILLCLKQLSLQSKAAFLVWQTAQQCIYNVKNVLAQKGLYIIDYSKGQINIDLGRATGLKRMQPRAKGSGNTIEKYRVYINVIITNEVAHKIPQEAADGSTS